MQILASAAALDTWRRTTAAHWIQMASESIQNPVAQ
jgi:hypothetical protein